MSYFNSLMSSVGVKAENKANSTIQSHSSNIKSEMLAQNKRKAEGAFGQSAAKAQRMNSTSHDVKSSHHATSDLTKKSLAKQQDFTNIERRVVQTAGMPASDDFANMMARAKSIQGSKLAPGGGIRNRSKAATNAEAIERRKKLLESKSASEARKNGRTSRTGSTEASAGGRSGSRTPNRSRAPTTKVVTKIEKPKRIRTPVVVSYKGTMRSSAKQPSGHTSAVAKPNDGSVKRERPSSVASSRFGRDYNRDIELDDEDEEEDDDEDDRGGYGSDASSDMEAGVWDVGHEEELAEQEARREDAREKRLEDELKRKKLMRKQGIGR